MEARVVREMLKGLDALTFNARCDRCKHTITTEDARYSCEACNMSYCTSCSSMLLSTPLDIGSVARPLAAKVLPSRSPGNVLPGDILYCGPDAWGIHHLILVIGNMEPDPEAAEFLNLQKDAEVWSCQTIECTRNRVGREIAWFSTRTFYSRCSKTGAAAMIGSLEPGTSTIEHFECPVPVKLLMHPLRSGHGGPPFEAEAFEQAVALSSVLGKRWGLSTALKGLFARHTGQECLDPENYPTPGSRRQLLEELATRWSSNPICSSVVIMVWQYYFKIASGSTDAAAKHILRWMPLLSDSTMPSVLLKVLTKLGWVLRGNLDA